MWMRNRWKVHREFVSAGRSLAAAKLARVRAREGASSLLNINLKHIWADDNAKNPEMQANSGLFCTHAFSTLLLYPYLQTSML